MIRVTRSTVIRAPIDRVWSVLRDFNSHTEWHPAIPPSRHRGIAESKIEHGEPSDRDHRLTDCILNADIPLENYVATV